MCQKENVPVSGEAGIEIRVDGMPNNKEEGFVIMFYMIQIVNHLLLLKLKNKY